MATADEDIFTTWTSEINDKDIVVVYLCGELDASTVPNFLNDLRAIIDSRKHIILDAHLLSYVDSTGVGAILSTRSALEQSDLRMCIVGSHGLLSKILHITRADDYIDCFGDIQSAVDAIHAVK